MVDTTHQEYEGEQRPQVARILAPTRSVAMCKVAAHTMSAILYMPTKADYMATAPQMIQPGQQPAQQPAKAKRKRSPSAGEACVLYHPDCGCYSGNPMPFDKKRVKRLKAERSADAVLGDGRGWRASTCILYLRGIVPVTRTTNAPRTPQTNPPTPI